MLIEICIMPENAVKAKVAVHASKAIERLPDHAHASITIRFEI